MEPKIKGVAQVIRDMENVTPQANVLQCPNHQVGYWRKAYYTPAHCAWVPPYAKKCNPACPRQEPVARCERDLEDASEALAKAELQVKELRQKRARLKRELVRIKKRDCLP